MNWEKHIHSDPEILLGKPVIRGTRLSVEFIIQEQLLENYPQLSKEALQAIFAYVGDCLRDGLLFENSRKSA